MARSLASFQSTRPIRGATGAAPCRRRSGLHFNPRAPYGARLPEQQLVAVDDVISIHAPHTGRDLGGLLLQPRDQISIHAPHTGRDVDPRRRWTALLYFNPRAPYGARLQPHRTEVRLTDFNPRAPYGARPTSTRVRSSSSRFQSTRPIRGATRRDGAAGARPNISIHAPHTGRDDIITDEETLELLFQSTRPIRGATPSRPARCTRTTYFNPRAPYGARRLQRQRRPAPRYFNPRAPYGARPAQG